MATDPTQMFGALLNTLQQSGNIDRNAQAYQQQQQQNKLLGLAISAKQEQQQQAQQYQDWVTRYSDNPSLQLLSEGMARFPQMVAALKSNYDVMNTAQKQSTTTQLGEIYNAADNGAIPILKTKLGQLKQAEQAQGIDTSDIDWALSGLDTDPTATMRYLKGFAQAHLAAAGVKGFIPDSYTLAPGDVRYDGSNHVVARGGYKPDVRSVDVYDKTGNKIGQKLIDVGSGPVDDSGASVPSNSAPDSLDPHQFFKDFVLPHEGGYAAHDANGAPVNYGINQSANPGVDVKNLTPDQAADIFTNKYWAQSGSANLPPALAAVNADTAYINPARAQQFLKASGGDPQKYLQMRKAWMASLVKKDPAKYGPYANAWTNRNNDLAQYMRQVGSANAPSSIASPASAGGRVLFDSEGTGEGATTPGNTNLSGDAYIATLPTGLGNRVRGILEGKIPYPNSQAQRSSTGQMLMNAISQADPTFDATKWQQRQQTAKDYAPGGKVGLALISMKTIINHLYDLAKASDDLGGFGFTPLNAVRNSWRDHTSNPAYQKYTSTVTNLAPEQAKFLSGKAPGEHEIENVAAGYDVNKGPGARKAQIAQTLELINGRFGPILDAYRDAMGGKEFDPDAQPGGKITGKLAALDNWVDGGKLAIPTKANRASAAARPSSASSPPPAAAVQYLRSHPALAAQFDQKYGLGAAAKAMAQ